MGNGVSCNRQSSTLVVTAATVDGDEWKQSNNITDGPDQRSDCGSGYLGDNGRSTKLAKDLNILLHNVHYVNNNHQTKKPLTPLDRSTKPALVTAYREMQLKWKNVQTIENHLADVTGCDFGGGPGKRMILATCSSDKTVRLFESDVDGIDFVEKEFSPLLGHTYALTAVQFAPNSHLLCSASVDGTCNLWNAEVDNVLWFVRKRRCVFTSTRRRQGLSNGNQLVTLRHPSSNSLRTCAFSPSGALLATGGDDETLVIWDVATRSSILTMAGHEATVRNSVNLTPPE
ncbi:WD repeat [Tropilaelaps mercedesae]|uniref:WD repeat n=1 Tax=Tropilaelaps mercedesae TaxID=418985 RepID=A0A1V9Y0X1_9ACAR|nr:WD repeat [Tropilaelaps mercedesae]